MKNLSIILCGDLCPTDDTLSNFLNNDKEALFGDVLDVFKKGDIVFGNLEYVLTDNPKPITKAGPILHAPKKTLNVIKDAGFNILSLANNHIKDCGIEGVKSTIETCNKNEVLNFGAGKNLKEAKKPLVIEQNGYRIGFISFAEQEFNIATATEYGASYFDPYEDLDVIKDLKNQVDYLVVIYHGGIEYYEYPSPILQKKCRKFVDKGADIVLCQHSHCIGTLEKYKDSSILYGQGNTLFGYKDNNTSWNQGLIIKLSFVENSKPTLGLIPITAHKNGGIKQLDKENSIIVLKNLNERSTNLYDSRFIENEWNKFVNKHISSYMPYLYGFNRYFIHLNRFTNNTLIKMIYGKRIKMVTQNIIRCEAHNEVIQSILKK